MRHDPQGRIQGGQGDSTLPRTQSFHTSKNLKLKSGENKNK